MHRNLLHIKMMLPGDTLHQIHDELVVIVGKVTVCENRGQLKLVDVYKRQYYYCL